MEVTARVEMDAVMRELRAAHYEVPNKIRSVLKTAAERTVEPAVERLTPSVVRPRIVARTTTTRAYITTTGPKQDDRITGLLNFGGYLDTPIYPKKGKAVMTPWGPRSVVYRGSGGQGRPGRITGKHFIERGIDASMPAVIEAFEDGILDAFGSLPTSKT